MHTLFPCIVDCDSIALRDVAVRIEQSPVEIQSQKTNRHKEATKVAQEREAAKRATKRHKMN